MEEMLARFANPAFSGFMLMTISYLLYQILQVLQGIREQLRSWLEQENRWRQ